MRCMPYIAAMLLLTPALTFAATQQGGSTCQLADAAARNQIIMSRDAVTIGDQVFAPPSKPTEMACLGGIIQGGGNGSLNIPSVADVLGGVLDRACSALEDAWNQGTRRIMNSVSLPYGLGEIASTGGYEVGLPGTGEVIDGATGGGISDAIGGVVGGINQGAGGIYDQIGGIKDAEEGAVGGVQDSVNIYGGAGNGTNIYQ